MSLRRRDNEEGQVDPENGRFVEMEGVMEVRFISGADEIMERQDFYEFQDQTRSIPSDFCHKDMDTGEQAIFFCLVCDCELKSIIPLKSHVEGQKHIRKATAYKQRTLGYEPEPVNQPKRKKLAAPKIKIDCNQSLKERLLEFEGPILGLNHITEYTCVTNRKAPPMYSCKLVGCKSAWGNSDDMFNHVKGHKHIRNYFTVLYEDDDRVNSQNKNDLLKMALDECIKHDIMDAKERDYDTIIPCQDLAAYQEIESRPLDWSEKKGRLQANRGGGVGSNSNLIPLGKKDRGLFNEKKWMDFKAPTKEEALDTMTSGLEDELTAVEKMIEEEDDDKIILMQIDLSLDLIEFDFDTWGDRPEFANHLREDIKVKKKFLALKESIEKKQKPITSSQQRQLDREIYTQKFTDQMKAQVQEIAEKMLKGKAAIDIDDVVKKIVDEKVLPKQIQNFQKKEQEWKEFQYNDKTRDGVERFTKNYLNTKYISDN
jgi:hypothetical protein